MFPGVSIGLRDPLMGPVGNAEAADLPGLFAFVQRLDQLCGRRVRVIPVKKIEIHVVNAQGQQALFQLFEDHSAVDVYAPEKIDVPALGQQHDLLPVLPRTDPLAEHMLRLPVAPGTVKGIDPEIKCCIKKPVRVPSGKDLRDRRTEEQAGDRLFEACDRAAGRNNGAVIFVHDRILLPLRTPPVSPGRRFCMPRPPSLL